MQAADRQNPSNPPAVSWGRFGLLAAAAVVFLILDQATKAWIQAAFFEGEFIRVLPFFNLCHVRNTGAAFSFLSDAGGWQTAFFVTMASVVAVIALITMKRTANRFFQWASVLIVSGAVGTPLTAWFWEASSIFSTFILPAGTGPRLMWPISQSASGPFSLSLRNFSPRRNEPLSD